MGPAVSSTRANNSSQGGSNRSAKTFHELSVAMKVFRCAIVCPNPKHEKLLITEAGDDENIDPLDQSSTHFNFELLEYLLENHSFYETREDGSIQKSFVYYKPENDADLFPVRELLVAAQMGSMVIQPIIYRGSSKGIIIVAETDPRRRWAESELELVKAVAGQVAVAVEQSSLIEALHKINEDLLQKNVNLDAKNVQLKSVQSQMIHQEKMASLGRLVAGIAHELNNPINFVHGNLPYLKEYVEDLKKLVDSIDIEKLPQEQQRKLKELKEKVKYDFLVADLDNIIADLNEGADRIRTIIRNLRSFSRLDEAELKEASIHDGLDSSLKILSQYYGSHLITINKDYSELPPVMCNPGQLNQVWMNLLANAAQAVGAKKNGVITITTRHADDKLIVEVRDNGSGIALQNLKRIFDPFFSTKGHGRGLGLSATLGIIRAHKGGLHVESQVGVGSTFRVFLPAAAQPKHQTDQTDDLGKVNLSGTVLVIDDDTTVRDSLSEMLEMAGLNVLKAANGEEGLACFQENQHAVLTVLLDVHMPVMNGPALIGRLRAMSEFKFTPILVLTTESSAERKNEGKAAGATGWVVKPFDPARLIQVVNRLVP
mgnify:CR=1 FL=1